MCRSLLGSWSVYYHSVIHVGIHDAALCTGIVVSRLTLWSTTSIRKGGLLYLGFYYSISVPELLRCRLTHLSQLVYADLPAYDVFFVEESRFCRSSKNGNELDSEEVEMERPRKDGPDLANA